MDYRKLQPLINRLERRKLLDAGGPGILVVGQAILEPVIAEFPED